MSPSQSTSTEKHLRHHDKDILKYSNLRLAQNDMPSSSSTVPTHPSRLQSEAQPGVFQMIVRTVEGGQSTSIIDFAPKKTHIPLELGTEINGPDTCVDETITTPSNQSSLDGPVDKVEVNRLDPLALRSKEPTALSNIHPALRDGFVDDDTETEVSDFSEDDYTPLEPDEELIAEEPSKVITSSNKIITTDDISCEDAKIRDLQAAYFDVVDILGQFRQCLDIAIKLYIMTRNVGLHKHRANETIAMINKIDVERRPYQFKLVTLNKKIEKSWTQKTNDSVIESKDTEDPEEKVTWTSTKTSRVISPVYLRLIQRQAMTWKNTLENVGERNTEMKKAGWELEDKFDGSTRVAKMTSQRLRLFDDQKE